MLSELLDKTSIFLGSSALSTDAVFARWTYWANSCSSHWSTSGVVSWDGSYNLPIADFLVLKSGVCLGDSGFASQCLGIPYSHMSYTIYAYMHSSLNYI